MKKPLPTVELSFQDIDERTLAEILPANTNSRYHELKIGLMAKIETATGPFLFGAKNKLDEKEIMSLMHSVNSFLHKEGIAWRIKYSTKAQAFACFPMKVKKLRHTLGTLIPRATKRGQMTAQELIAIAEKIFNTNLKREVDNPNRDFSKAVCYVGNKVCHIRGRDFCEPFEYSRTGPSWCVTHALDNPISANMVKLLTNAVKKHLGE